MAFHPMADVLQRILQLFLCADERMRAGRFGWVTTSFKLALQALSNVYRSRLLSFSTTIGF
jgi:hypothetical protein